MSSQHFPSIRIPQFKKTPTKKLRTRDTYHRGTGHTSYQGTWYYIFFKRLQKNPYVVRAIEVSYVWYHTTACSDEFRRNLRSHSSGGVWLIFVKDLVCVSYRSVRINSVVVPPFAAYDFRGVRDQSMWIWSAPTRFVAAVLHIIRMDLYCSFHAFLFTSAMQRQ